MTITFPIQPTFEFYDLQGNLRIMTSPILHRFLLDLTTETNTVAADMTNIEDTENFGTELQDRIDDVEQIADLIPSVLNREFYIDVKTDNYTAINNDFIEGRNGITIKFDINSEHNAQIITANGDSSSIIVDGNGLELRHAGRRDGRFVLNREGTSIHWYKVISGTEAYWRSG